MDLIPQTIAWDVAIPFAKQVPVSHQDPTLLQLIKKDFMSESVNAFQASRKVMHCIKDTGEV